MKQVLLIVNGPAYGSDETYNALRLAVALARRDDVSPRLFLMGDAVTCAVAGQKTADGYYKFDRMLKAFARGGRRGRVLRHLPRRPRPHPRGAPARGAALDHGQSRRLDRRG